jgi:putative transposase
MERKDYLHNPTHIFADDTPYFITAAIYQKRPLLNSPALKLLLLDRIQSCFAQYQWELHHWVILDNHYHILGKSRVGKDLPKIITNIHAFTGYHIKKISQTQKRVWWNYWDYCPRNERDYNIRLIYLLNNPVKHGYVNDLHNYQFSSFHNALLVQGAETLRRQFKEYPEFRTLTLREAYDDDF